MPEDERRPNANTSYPVPPEDLGLDEPLSEKVNVPIFHPDLNNMGEDELMTKSFADIAQIKVDSGEWKKALGTNYSDFDELKDCLKPAYRWGAAAALTQFCFLRWAGARYMKRSIKKGFLWPHRLVIPKNETWNEARKQRSVWQSRIVTRPDGSTEFKEGLISRPITLLMDFVVSLLCGGVVTAVKANKEKMYESLQSIPLRSGQSPVANVLCKDFLMQDAKIPKELWEEHTDDGMRALRTFLDNCQRRSAYEDRLRRASFLSPDEPVDIPEPGVPLDLDEEGFIVGALNEATSPEEADAAQTEAWEPDDLASKPETRSGTLPLEGLLQERFQSGTCAMSSLFRRVVPLLFTANTVTLP